MSPSAPEDEGPHGRKRSRGGEERPRERERPRRDEKERSDKRREGERDARRRRDERDGDRDGSRRPRRRFRDSVDAPHPPDDGGRKEGLSKVEEAKEEEKKGGDGGRGRDRDRDRIDGAPHRSRSYLQHDDRGSAGHGGRDMVHRAGEQRRWNDIKEQSGDRFRDNRFSRDNPLKKDEDPRPPKLDDDSAWKHDGFYELEAGAPPPRKRPAFREKKPEGREATAGESADLPPRHETGQDIREDGGQNPRGRERYERSFAVGGNRDLRRAEGPPPRYGHPFKDRYGGASGARGRDRFGGRRYDGRNFHQPGGFQVEKWKHDLFEEANRSPTPKNDEDKLAKLEALLAS